VSSWLEIFERLYLSFRIYPYAHRNIRSLKKAPKIYLWDWSTLENKGARFENLIACHLLKLKHTLEDQEGYHIGLHYLRDSDKREVDFLITVKNTPWFAVECKISEKRVSNHLSYFSDRLQIPWKYQVIMDKNVDILNNHIRVISADKFLSALP
jgi:predicted AAA+ superfamily ATPase